MALPASSTSRVVVGAAIVADGRVLSARRSTPPALAGGWELPGGKLEPGETLAVACEREVSEELGCRVEALGELGTPQGLSDGYTLRVMLAELVSGEPLPSEHDALRWLAPDELDDVAWLEADRPFLPELRNLLSRPVHAGFHDREDGQAALTALDDPRARLVRDRFAGEDDDEDVGWLLEAPPSARAALAELAVRHCGWLVAEAPPGLRVEPQPLPDGPKRIKRAH